MVLEFEKSLAWHCPEFLSHNRHALHFDFAAGNFNVRPSTFRRRKINHRDSRVEFAHNGDGDLHGADRLPSTNGLPISRGKKFAQPNKNHAARHGSDCCGKFGNVAGGNDFRRFFAVDVRREGRAIS